MPSIKLTSAAAILFKATTCHLPTVSVSPMTAATTQRRWMRRCTKAIGTALKPVAESAARGLCRGRGIANYIEVIEWHSARARRDCRHRRWLYRSGRRNDEQWARSRNEFSTAAVRMAGSFKKIRFVVNDTNRVSVGGGSHSGRSMRRQYCRREVVEALLEKGKAIAAHAMQAPIDEIEYAEGAFHESWRRQPRFMGSRESWRE